MSAYTEYIHFLEVELPAFISQGVEACFDIDTDPEVAWAAFRDGMRTIKKRHIELYRKYAESDDETVYCKRYGKEFCTGEDIKRCQMKSGRNEYKGEVVWLCKSCRRSWYNGQFKLLDM